MSKQMLAMVTGASRGIGAAIAQRLALDGCKVLTPSRAEMDLESNESIDKFLLALDPAIDILVHDAGVNRIANLDEVTEEDIRDTLQVNLIAPFRLTQAVSRLMKPKNYGRIVNISSIWSMVSKPGRSSYTMSKSAVNGMTRSLAVELAPYNVLINAVAPGYVLTDLTRQNNSEAELEKISKAIPVRRLASPKEIANVVAFLCSDQNTYLTGQTIIVDGGYTCL
jgi:3-oxoacyl-[acyl-carrier protein] reductase